MMDFTLPLKMVTPKFVKALIERGANLEAKDNNYGWTSSSPCRLNGQTETVKTLIAAKANLEVTDDNGWTALHIAAQNGHSETVKILAKALIELEANLDAKNNNGWTALHFAAEKGHTEIVEILANLGADLEAQMKKNGQLFTLLKMDTPKLLKYLLKLKMPI